MIIKDKYEEYKNSLLNAARLTHKDNSILIDFNIVGGECFNNVSYIQRDGTKDLLEKETFVVDKDFYNDFLEKLICEYYNNMDVAFNDSIDINEDGLYTYRVITEDNDMLSVDGISLEYAKKLMNLINKEENILDNEKALATWNITMILVFGIGLSFIFLSLLLG